MMDDVEPDVRSELVCIGVVLEKSVQKYAGRKSVKNARAKERCSERAIGQSHPVIGGVQVDIQPVIRSPIQSSNK
jgi:hypothetical protein